MHPVLPKAVWYWNSYSGKLECEEFREFKPVRSCKSVTIGESLTNIEFQENVNQKLIKQFKLQYQRVVQPEVPAVVTLQDVKDVVTFFVVGSIPHGVLRLLHSDQSNKLFRALIIYFQLYLKIWEDLKHRKLAYLSNRLKHPVAVEREALCRKHLSSLRALVGHEYASLVTGTGFYKRFHHMNNRLNHSYYFKDTVLYEYLFKFTARVVWIALQRSNYKEIELELSRLFSYTPSLDKRSKKTLQLFMSKSDKNILYGQECKSNFDSLTPIVDDIFKNEYNTDGFSSKLFDYNKRLTGLEAMMDVPEEMFDIFGLTVGILGLPREDYEPTLHAKPPVTVHCKIIVEETLEINRNLLREPEKPSVMMYQLLEDLDRNVDMQHMVHSKNIALSTIRDMVILFNETHLQDSNHSYNMWKHVKSS